MKVLPALASAGWLGGDRKPSSGSHELQALQPSGSTLLWYGGAAVSTLCHKLRSSSASIDKVQLWPELLGYASALLVACYHS